MAMYGRQGWLILMIKLANCRDQTLPSKVENNGDQRHARRKRIEVACHIDPVDTVE